MACLIKAPDSSGKGCVSFTTPERDNAIYRDAALRAAVEKLKDRYLIGLHHNWHDHAFSYDPLFDFSMAGEGDLIERDGKPFPSIPIDACNFAPPCFHQSAGTERFWDVLNVSRAVSFKGIPEFFNAIRKIYDGGRFLRVLYLCPVPPAESDGSSLHDIRQRYEAMFSTTERRYFNLMTMEWDYPFPLDLDTLSFFYRASKVYVHPAPEERRCRIAGYAWATGMPVVGRENIASILPSTLRRPPFWHKVDSDRDIADAILSAVDQRYDSDCWGDVVDEFKAVTSAQRLSSFLAQYGAGKSTEISTGRINWKKLDLRLGRHHLPIKAGANTVIQTIAAFCSQLSNLPIEKLQEVASHEDVELFLVNSVPAIYDREPMQSARTLTLRQRIHKFQAIWRAEVSRPSE